MKKISSKQKIVSSLILTVLLSISFSAKANQCTSLFEQSEQTEITHMDAINELRSVLKHASASVSTYQNKKTGKVVTFVYERNRILTDNRNGRKFYAPYNPFVMELMTTSFKRMAQKFNIAIMNPYFYSSDTKSFAKYPLYEMLRQETDYKTRPHELHSFEYAKKIKETFAKNISLQMQNKFSFLIAYATGITATFASSDFYTAMPILLSAIGFAATSSIKTKRGLKENERSLTMDMAHKLVAESLKRDRQMSVVVVPESIKKNLNDSFNQNSDYQLVYQEDAEL